MTAVILGQEERRKRQEHHIVHDYANLVSSGRMTVDGIFKGVVLMNIAPVNSHVEHAFYTYCRSMFEFFTFGPHNNYLRAKSFLKQDVDFSFRHWTQRTVHKHIVGHVVHTGVDRTANTVPWTGDKNALYLADFAEAWELFLKNLKDEHKEIFRDEIGFRLNSEFDHCGDLGAQFIV